MTDAPWARRLRRLSTQRGVTAAAAYWMLLIGVSLTASWITPYDPQDILDPLRLRSQPPSWQHLLGTDPYARDVFSRLIAGARVSVGLAVASVTVATVIGVGVGIGSALAGGWIDRVLMRGVDVALAIPRVLLLLVVAATWGALSLPALALVLGATGWMGLSRLVRGEVRALQGHERLLAARALGVPPLTLVRRHVLPDLVPLILVAATNGLGQVLLLESGLSFLGLGVAPPSASWGSVLLDLSDVVGEGRWLALGPGLLLTLTVVTMQRIGDAVQTVLDERLSL